MDRMKKFSIETNGDGSTRFGGDLEISSSARDMNFMTEVEESVCEIASSVAVQFSKHYCFPPCYSSDPIRIKLEIEFLDTEKRSGH